MIVAVDGNAEICKQFFAAGSMAMHNFRRRLEAIESTWGHFLSHKIVAFDSKTSQRKLLCPSYKADRSEKPKELYECLEKAVVITLECDWTAITIDGWEADDILASVAKQGSNAGHKVVLVAQDKDIAQCLVSGKVTQLRGLKMEYGVMKPEFMKADDVPARFGVRAEQMIDYQTLVGDGVDGINGVEGVGLKTAVKILKERPTLEAFFDNPWVCGLGEKLRTRLLEYRGEACEMTRKLVTLKTDLDLAGTVDFSKETSDAH